MSKRPILTAILVATMAASAASAQILGGSGGPLGGVTGPVGGVIGQVGNTVDRTVGTVTGQPNNPSSFVNPSNPVSLDSVSTPLAAIAAPAALLSDVRKARLAALIRANRDTLDRDGEGQPVRKGELVVTDPDPASLALAQRAGFRILRDEQAGDLGIRMITLSLPRKMDVREGLKALRKAAPSLQADYNHIYEPAGGALLPATAVALAAAPARAGTRIAMIDGGVASHPSLARAGIEQRGFNGSAQPTGHGTAVGSLLVGEQGPFRGAARGAQLFVGDVYGGNPAAGSATAIVRALGWAASKKPSVINISLVGPANRTLARAIGVLRARGMDVVAAVGNDGPAAPPQYPASYPGVVAVTGVDSNNRALREAGRSTHLDFAAPGADLAAALPGKGYTAVRGTSFAAPFVAARLAATGSTAALAGEAIPGKGKVGRGIVCGTCEISPKSVGLK
jgi:hypothetical protein